MTLILPPDFVRASGRWSGIESESRGLIHGPAVLWPDRPVAGTPATSILTTQGLIRKDLTLDGLHYRTDWAPWRKTFTICIRARDGREILWARAFASERDAALTWARLCHIDVDRLAASGRRVELPGVFVEGELEYSLATTVTFNASNTDNTHDWANAGNLVPSYVNGVDYIDVASGGGGGTGTTGGGGGGGGGAGEALSALGLAVTPGASTTITVGASAATDTTGNNSVFASVTALGGGKGGTPPASSGAGGNGGSGGGGSGTGGTAGTATGSGHNGGTGNVGATNAAAGGGGQTSAGNNNSGANGGNGGNGNTITLDGVVYGPFAGGAGGGANSAGSASGGGGGTGGGASGGGASGGAGVAGGTGTANTGGAGGGGGNGGTSAGAGGPSGSGVIVITFNFVNILFRWDDSAENLIVAINKPRPVAY